MDFSKTKKKKKTKKKDLDEFIAEDEKKKAEDKENGIRFYIFVFILLFLSCALTNVCIDLRNLKMSSSFPNMPH
jgi:hypothetical protein